MTSELSHKYATKEKNTIFRIAPKVIQNRNSRCAKATTPYPIPAMKARHHTILLAANPVSGVTSRMYIEEAYSCCNRPKAPIKRFHKAANRRGRKYRDLVVYCSPHELLVICYSFHIRTITAYFPCTISLDDAWRIKKGCLPLVGDNTLERA